MLKFFLIIWKLIRAQGKGRSTAEGDDARWLADPLSHPQIARMDARQLADLPWPRRILDRQG